MFEARWIDTRGGSVWELISLPPAPPTAKPALGSLLVGPELAAALADTDAVFAAQSSVGECGGEGARVDVDVVDVMVARSRLIAHLQAGLLSDLVLVSDASVAEIHPELASDFEAHEISAALCWTLRAAEGQLGLAGALVRRLPDVHAALSDGVIDLPRARVFADVLGPVTDDDVARRIAALVLPTAGKLTTSQIRGRLRRRVLAADPAATRRRYDLSVAGREVHVWANPDGTGGLSAVFLPPARAQAAFERVDAIARSLRTGGDTRTLPQLRADTLLDLLDGTTPSGAPADRPGIIEFTVPWATIAQAGSDPGDLAGFGPVLADIARQIVTDHQTDQWRYSVRHPDTGDLLFHGTTSARPAPPSAAEPDGARPPEPTPTPSSTPEPAEEPTVPTVAEPASLVRSDASDDRAMPASDHPATPAQASPEARSANSGSGIGSAIPAARPPRQAERDRFPSVAMRRWITARDHTCRFPTCNAPARCCDIDHCTEHSRGGPTRHDNLELLCRRHHRLKHEGGWKLTRNSDGTCTWTTPTGHTYIAEPDDP